MRKVETSFRQIAVWGFLTLALSLVPLYLFDVKWGAGSPVHPFSDDSILVWNIFQGLIRGDVHPFRSMVLPRMAAPFTPLVFSEGFPITEQLQLSVLKLISYFVRDPVELGDFYYIAGYVMAALSFFASAVWIGILPALAFGLSFAFAYLPFHWIRYDHIFLSHYWVLAPAAAVLLRATSATFSRRGEKIGIALFAFFVALWHSYYGFFFCGMLGLILFARLVGRTTPAARRAFLKPAVIVLSLAGVVSVAAIGISTIHYVVARRESQDPPPQFSRVPGEARLYQMRIPAMLLPREEHRFTPFAEIRAAYMRSVPLREGVNEAVGSLATLGILAGIFLFLRRWVKKQPADDASNLGLCEVLVFLFAGPWGVAVMISMWITPIFRCPNRISPMLGAFGLFTTGLLLSQLFKRRFRYSRVMVPVTGVILGVFAVWDQVPAFDITSVPQHEIAVAKNFVAKIDQAVGSGAVLQLPMAPFPEWPPIYRMPDYAHSIAPLFSRDTRYSYGAWKESKAFYQMLRVAAHPLGIETLKEFGYSGIWIDRYGYPDEGAELISALRLKLRREPLVSEDGRRVFFSFAR